MSKIPRGYELNAEQSKLRGANGEVPATLWVLTHKKKNFRKVFISEAAVYDYFKRLDFEKTAAAALAGKGAPTKGKGAILKAEKELKALKELTEEFDGTDLEDDEF